MRGLSGCGTVQSLRGVLALVAMVLVAAAPARGQVRLDDLVFTGGISMEGYRGNFSAVSVTVVDSTNEASAAVGEFGLRGTVSFLEREDTRILADFDGGFRQFAAAGFQLRDYAPREWVGEVSTTVWHQLQGLGSAAFVGTFRGRNVDDRPPLPLFLQPGYATYRGELELTTVPLDGVMFDLALSGEVTDYQALNPASTLDLLDRDSRGLEIGAEWGTPTWTIRFHTGYATADFPRQPSFLPEDPIRRDQTVTVGGAWRYTGDLIAEVGLEGTLNRSNSRRPEYDAVSLRTNLTVPLPWWELSTSLFGVLTGKSYIHETPFTRLVPGEEADNASVLYLDVVRPMAPDLDGRLRFGWTRAETEIGESYYSRFGVTFQVNYRPELP